jgi:hypothetical protein
MKYLAGLLSVICLSCNQGCHSSNVVHYSNESARVNLRSVRSIPGLDTTRSYVEGFDTLPNTSDPRFEPIPNIGDDQGFRFRLAMSDSVTIYYIRTSDSSNSKPFRMHLRAGCYWFQPYQIYFASGNYVEVCIIGRQRWMRLVEIYNNDLP